MQSVNQEQIPILPRPPRSGYGSESSTGSPHKQLPERKIRSALSTILILIAAPLIAIVLTTLVFQSYQVDGPSMETTLQHNDRLIVLKTGKTWASLTGRDYIPNRGEIVVFTHPSEGGRQLIKRVIALPGERVVVAAGRLTVHNDTFPGGFSPDQNPAYRHNIDPVTPGDVDLIVPPGEIFVAGDNRSHSLDSRAFGTVRSQDIVGSLAFRLYPFSKFEVF